MCNAPTSTVEKRPAQHFWPTGSAVQTRLWHDSNRLNLVLNSEQPLELMRALTSHLLDGSVPHGSLHDAHGSAQSQQLRLAQALKPSAAAPWPLLLCRTAARQLPTDPLPEAFAVGPPPQSWAGLTLRLAGWHAQWCSGLLR
jgi:hypothetical protein